MSEAVFPTKSNLMAFKKNLDLARLGFDLLDRKRNVLMREMMRLIDEAADLQRSIGTTFEDAYAALQRANVTLGIENNVITFAQEENGLHLESRSVMGVDLPTVTLDDSTLRPYYGFGETNDQLDEAYISFEKVKRLTARLAEIDNSVYRLALAIQKTQRRANLLENISIPKFAGNVRFIQGVLEEREREEFTRLKVIKSQKEKKAAGGIDG